MVRKLLIWVPIIFIVFLLQSYFWVPTYEQETKGNPERLSEYIDASIGDAQVVNPVLSADSASSTIESRVFEGLIDRDENLNFRGRVATHWDIFEEAYFYINDQATPPGASRGAQGMAAFLQKEIASRKGKGDSLSRSLANIEKIEVLPPTTREITKEEKGPGGKSTPVILQLTAPERIRLTLKEVDQDLFNRLPEIFGKEYFSTFDGSKYLSVPEAFSNKKAAYLKEFVPPTEHNPVIVFHLRPGVLFHDGQPVTAEDVRFTYESLMNPRNLSPRVSDFEPVKSVEVVDPLTVRIVYKYLYSPGLGTWGMGILPKHLLSPEVLRKEALRRGRDPEKFTLRESEFNRHPVGCGAFRFQEWRSGQYIILDRFKDYWEGPAKYRGYAFRVIPDMLTQEMEFYAGTLDSYAVQPFQVERLEKDPRYQHFSGLSFGYSYIGYNMRREPFKDRRVRTALGMAIDVNKIIKYVLYGQGKRMTGPFPEQTDYYDQKVKPLSYDPEGALRLLAEAGWTKGPDGWLQKNGKRLQFTLITNQGNSTRKAILAVAQNSWRQIGIDVRTDVLEWAVFIQERVDKHDFDALVLGWVMGIDPDLYQIWHSSQTQANQLNFVAFENAKADDLIVRIRQEYNHDKQVEYCHDLHRIIAEEQPYTFLYVGKWTAILDKRIVIEEVDSRGKPVYRRIEPTKTGDYTFYFNKWIKLPQAPKFGAEG